MGNSLGEASWQTYKETADFILHNTFPEGNALSSEKKKKKRHFKQVFCKYTSLPPPPPAYFHALQSSVNQ